MLDIQASTREDIQYVKNNLREMDAMETYAVGEEETFVQRVLEADVSLTLYDDGEPIAVCGFHDNGRIVQLYFIGTDGITKNFKNVWRFAEMSLNSISLQYPMQNIDALVLMDYKSSVKWLEKMGFEDQQIDIGIGKTKLRRFRWFGK